MHDGLDADEELLFGKHEPIPTAPGDLEEDKHRTEGLAHILVYLFCFWAAVYVFGTALGYW